MKFNLKENIRQLLKSIVLPIRRRREKWMGNFRFSIAFRISLYYLKLLLIHGVFFLLLFSLLYFAIEYKSNKIKVDFMIEEYTNKNLLPFSDGEKNPLYINGVNIKIVDTNTKNIIYSDMDRDITNQKLFMNYIFYEKNEKIFDFIIMEKDEISIDMATYDIYIQYNLLDSSKKFNWLLSGVGILYLLLVYVIVRQGRKSDLKLLQPIYEIICLIE